MTKQTEISWEESFDEKKKHFTEYNVLSGSRFLNEQVLKEFISTELQKARLEERENEFIRLSDAMDKAVLQAYEELESKLPEERIINEKCYVYKQIEADNYNECLSEVKQIINELKNK